MAFTSQLGTADSILVGSTLTLGFVGETGTVLTAANSFAFTQDAQANIERSLTASTAVTFAQSGFGTREVDLTASTSITFAQSAEVPSTYNRTASTSVTFAQADVTASGKTLTASTAITFAQTADYTSEITLTASTAVTFAQAAHSGLYNRTATTSVTFAQSADEFGAIALTASTAITFAQTNNRIRAKASGIDLTASDSITFAQAAIFPIELTASTSVTFALSGDAPAPIAGSTAITFTQSAVVNREFSVTATTAVTFGQSFLYEQLRNGVVLNGVTKNYSPLIGAGPVTNPTPPRASVSPTKRQTDVVLYYPSTASPCGGATNSITLRTPNFGDRDRQAYNIINRESRGGTRDVFRDPNWPSQRVLVFDVSNLKETEAENLLTFLNTTVGLKIGMRDWVGRLWTGIIINPDTPIIRTHEDRIDVTLELEVDPTTYIDLSACSSVGFNQSTVDVEVMSP